MKLNVSKSLPCDFDIFFRVHVDKLIYEESILKSSENTTVVSVTLPDDEVALEPDENYVLTLSLLVPDPQVELGSHLSNLTVMDDESNLNIFLNNLCLIVVQQFSFVLIVCLFSLVHCSVIFNQKLDTVTVGFDGLREINVAEDSGSIEVSVSLRNDVAVPVSVDIVVINGTATEGQGWHLCIFILCMAYMVHVILWRYIILLASKSYKFCSRAVSSPV